MAANEHKNLSDANRHNPKGFEIATNDTVLSKSIGSGSTDTDGSLSYQSKSVMGVSNYKMQGYCVSGTANYKYGEDLQDTKSPYEMTDDYGATTVAGGTLNPSQVFRIGQSVVIPEISTVVNIKGSLSCNSTNAVTLAICKATPNPSSTSAITPTVIDEIIVTSSDGNNNTLMAIAETTITGADLLAGDIIFPMIRQNASTGSTIYFNVTIQTTAF
jgi:hypothetical protein